MTIEDFLRFLLRNALLLVVSALIGGALGFAASFTQQEVYQASALGYVSASAEAGPDGDPIAQASSNMQYQYSKAQTYLPLFGTRAVGQNIVEATGLAISADAAAGSLTASLDPNAPIITVEAKGSSPDQAQMIANAAVQAAAKEAARLETGGDKNRRAGVTLVPYQAANPPSAPISPDRRKFAAAGAAAMLLLGLGIAWLRNRNDSRIRSAEDLEKAAGTAVLGVLPVDKGLARSKGGAFPDPTDFRTREALRKLRTNLRFVDVDNPPRAVVITSSVPAEGKSTVAANLARVLARSGQRTLLIDADMRRPVVGRGFGLDDAVGLSQVLVGSISPEDAIHRIDDTLLWVMPAGQIPPNPSELLGSRRMQDLIAQMAETHFVLIDAPPVLAVTDAQLLARQADGAILVSVPGRSHADSIHKAVEAIRAVGGTVFGAVLNRASASRLKTLAYGRSEYGYAAYDAHTYGSPLRRGKGGHRYDTVQPELQESVPVDDTAPLAPAHRAAPERSGAPQPSHTPTPQTPRTTATESSRAERARAAVRPASAATNGKTSASSPAGAERPATRPAQSRSHGETSGERPHATTTSSSRWPLDGDGTRGAEGTALRRRRARRASFPGTEGSEKQ